jgi:hypothetical protein
MPSSFRTPKTLAEWLKLDYFRRESGLRRARTLLIAGVITAALLGVAVSFALPRGRQVFQAGPVSSGHASFGDQCEKCHTEPFRTAAHFVGAGDHSSVSDDACRSCHRGHAHHADVGARSAHCAACHREHRGHTALARAADGHCTACHSDPGGSVKSGVKVNFRNVPDFAAHPAFKLWSGPEAPTDPGRLNFSHHDHLVPLTVKGEKAGAPPVLRQLDCADCHQPDAGGLYMQPIRYEKHCYDCHPIFPALKDGKGADDVFRTIRLPHPGPGQSAETVRGVLRDRLTRLAQEHPAVLKGQGADDPERPIPGSRRAPPVDEEVFRWVDRTLGDAERVLFDKKGGCLLCHQEVGDPQQRTRGLPNLAPPNVPDRWFSHSVFSHRSHQAQDCEDCHKEARKSRDAADVLMPRLDDCRKCHNADSGVRSGCADCHAYHTPEVRRD